MKRLLLLAVITATVIACGSDSSTTPSPPSPPAPTRVQVAGIWTLTETRTGITGGECMQGMLDSTIGTTGTDTLTLTQSGSSLTAATTAQANGVSCNWTGTADTDRFALNLSSCQNNANQFGIRCANGAARDLRIASAGITAIINANGTYTGTKAEIYNVVIAGTLTQVGTMTFNENVSMTK